MDSIEVVPKQKTAVTGKDYMTDYHSWLHIQVGAQHSVIQTTSPRTSLRADEPFDKESIPEEKILVVELLLERFGGIISRSPGVST